MNFRERTLLVLLLVALVAVSMCAKVAQKGIQKRRRLEGCSADSVTYDTMAECQEKCPALAQSKKGQQLLGEYTFTGASECNYARRMGSYMCDMHACK